MTSFGFVTLFREFFVTSFAVSGIFVLASCAAPTSRVNEDSVPAGSLRLGQVLAVATRSEIVQNKTLYGIVTGSGVNDSDIVDGSIVAARIYCCGGLTQSTSSEVRNSLFLFVPRTLSIGQGDIVEIRVGHPPQVDAKGEMNSITRVVQKSGQDDGSCWWDPRNDRLWLRVLYCEWMPKEGWIKQGGSQPAWFKPASATSVAK